MIPHFVSSWRTILSLSCLGAAAKVLVSCKFSHCCRPAAPCSVPIGVRPCCNKMRSYVECLKIGE